ncbi:hypothetical protein QLX08_008066 [Tetragonisca angustula]|uniref:Uncharacterized protein n=1 Tax=Tetragonisca angustula TaxID=166442 RepID=A0AAW0ZLZ5_9HYME
MECAIEFQSCLSNFKSNVQYTLNSRTWPGYTLETKIQLRMAILRIEIRSGSVVRPSNGTGPGSRHSARTKEVRGPQTPWLHNRRRTWMAGPEWVPRCKG